MHHVIHVEMTLTCDVRNAFYVHTILRKITLVLGPTQSHVHAIVFMLSPASPTTLLCF